MIDFDVQYSGLKKLFRRFVETTQKIDGLTGDVLDWLGGRYAVIMRDILSEIDYSGRLRESVGHDVAGDKKSVEIGPNIPNITQSPEKIMTVWKGRQEAFETDLEELKNWAQVKLGNRRLGYFLWKRIKGDYVPEHPPGVSVARNLRETPGFSFVERTLDSPEGQVLLEEAGVRIGKQLIARITGE
jgi:hypothetical protein